MDATDRLHAAERDLRGVIDDLTSALDTYGTQGYPERAGAYGARIDMTRADLRRIVLLVERARIEVDVWRDRLHECRNPGCPQHGELGVTP